jgi:hypothetical protein
VDVKISPRLLAAIALLVWRERAKALGSETAVDLSSSNALRSRLLFSRCSWSSEMAERSAIASGFSLSFIGTGGGCGRKVAVGGGTARVRDGECCRGAASWATVAVGVMGDTGGRSGSSDVEEVSTKSAGMAEVKKMGKSVSGA